jgi:hypothetical protein
VTDVQKSPEIHDLRTRLVRLRRGNNAARHGNLRKRNFFFLLFQHAASNLSRGPNGFAV